MATNFVRSTAVVGGNAPINLVSPSNPNGYKFVSGITVSCPQGMSYQPSFYVNYP